MQNPAMLIPEATQPIQGLWAAVEKAGLPAQTLGLVRLRVSQINGCCACLDGGCRTAKKGGETDERLLALAVWRHAPYYADAQRAALALAELVLAIAIVNVWNRLNVAAGQTAGQW